MQDPIRVNDQQCICLEGQGQGGLPMFMRAVRPWIVLKDELEELAGIVPRLLRERVECDRSFSVSARNCLWS